jgi:hypothetical protein
MPKFRKRPVVEEVEAKRFDPKQPSSEWPFGVEWESEFRDQDGSRLGGYYKLKLYGGFDFIHAGDWVLYKNGARSVMSDKEFRATYEPVELTTPK